MAVGRVVTALLGAATAGTAALTVVRWIDAPTPPLLPALQAIVPAGLPAAALVTAVAAAVRRWRITAVSGILLAVHLVLAAAWWLPGPHRAAAGTGEPLVVLASNQQLGMGDTADVAAAVRERDVDVLVLVEATTATLDGLRAGGVTERLSHAAGTPADGMSASGTLILSRYPLRNAGVRAPPGLRHELPVAIVDAPSGDVLVAGVHPVSPVPRDTVVWHRELAALARWSTRLPSDLPVVLAGDFNATTDHPVFRRFAGAGLSDAQRELGRGRRRTWPTVDDGPPPLVDLDHVLIRGLDVTAFARLPMTDSDHDGVVASLVRDGG